MIALWILLAALLRLAGIDAHLYEDGSLGIATDAIHLSACVLPALGC